VPDGDNNNNDDDNREEKGTAAVAAGQCAIVIVSLTIKFREDAFYSIEEKRMNISHTRAYVYEKEKVMRNPINEIEFLAHF